MRLSLVLLLISLNVSTGLLVCQSLKSEKACLYATTVDGQIVLAEPCRGGDDPLGLAKDVDLARVIRAFNIRPDSLVFTGCDVGSFSTAEEHFSGSSQTTNRYVITYPLGARSNFLAPITHELAHVFQIEMAGGLERLQNRLESKRIELGADFLTGIAFSYALKQAQLGEFQHNLSVIGLYRDSSNKAHGSPVERTVAFRRGVFFPLANTGNMFQRANEDFQANIYGEIISVP